MAADEQGEVKLLGLIWSPYVMRVMVALNLKGVEYEYFNETLSDKSELLSNSNPVYKKVPVLLHNGKPICESMNIVEYIDEVWSTTGTAILLEDPYERVVHRFWAVYIDDKVKAGLGGPRAKTKEARAEAVEILINTFKLLEEAFEKCSKGKAFFNGDNIGYLDISLGGYLGWLKASEKFMGVKLFDEIKFPRLVEWAERFSSHEALKGVIPETDKVVEFAMTVGWTKENEYLLLGDSRIAFVRNIN